MHFYGINKSNSKKHSDHQNKIYEDFVKLRCKIKIKIN